MGNKTFVKILSDGTPENTRVLDKDNKPIGLVKSVIWEMVAGEPYAKAYIELIKVPVEVTGEMKVMDNGQSNNNSRNG